MNSRIIVIAMVALILGVGGGYWWAQRGMPEAVAPLAQAPKERKPLYYRNSMNPAVTSPVPKKDEMGMDYVPVYAEEEQGSAGMVSIDPGTVQNIGVRTVRAERRVLGQTIHAVGRVDYNEERLARLNPKTDGWVESLNVSVTGQRIAKGTVLLSLYSPQLVTAQQEYLLALQNMETLKDSPYEDLHHGAKQLVEAARARLELLDVPAHQIQDLETKHQISKTLHIHSPFDGVVVDIGVRPGQYVTPNTELYRIADLRKLWVYVDIYENELPWLRVGDSAEMHIAAAPGKVFRGRVTYIYPFVDPKTRTVRLRLEFDNHGDLLKPEMFVQVTLRTGLKLESVAVPSEAVIRSGEREQVFVVRAPGKFEPRVVELGLSAEGWSEIKRGVRAGEEVVTSAQFLIDSESKLREAAAKMSNVLQPSPSITPPTDDLDMSGISLSVPAGKTTDKQRLGNGKHQHD
ncbi:MAG: efflux RND transporter periplasmic adaptor subunit [Gammaproteobacteria bacterium]|nr:efflux RND transporter periplasmic adaptor subunit [Gammaproteobacteria bacterium]